MFVHEQNKQHNSQISSAAKRQYPHLSHFFLPTRILESVSGALEKKKDFEKQLSFCIKNNGCSILAFIDYFSPEGCGKYLLQCPHQSCQYNIEGDFMRKNCCALSKLISDKMLREL